MPGTFDPLKVHIIVQQLMYIHQGASQTQKDRKTSQKKSFSSFLKQENTPASPARKRE